MVIDGMTRYDLGKRYQQHPHRCGHTVLTANKELHGARPFTVFRVEEARRSPRAPLPFVSLMGCGGRTWSLPWPPSPTSNYSGLHDSVLAASQKQVPGGQQHFPECFLK